MILGLTGGIGSGKSTLARVFEVMNCAIYNSDDKAKEAYFITEVKDKVIALLGEEAYLTNTEINKPFISSSIFSNQLLLDKLNLIIHPVVKFDFENFVFNQPKSKHIIKETAILFEKNIHLSVDASILITAPLDLKIERVMKRNNISKTEVEKRMNAQWTDEQKIPLANYVIINDGVQALIPQVIQVLNKISKHA